MTILDQLAAHARQRVAADQEKHSLQLRQIMLEVPEVLDNARLTADGQHLYLIKNKLTNLR